MKKFMRIVLGLMVVLVVAILPANAERGGRGGHGGGGGHFGHGGGHAEFGLFVGPGLWDPYPYYPYYYPSPPVIVQQPPELYVQPNPQVETPGYWYFCQEPQGYYPYVKKCPKGWMKVIPPANPPEGEE